MSEIALEVRGLNYFTKDDPNVLFLDVVYPEALVDTRNKIAEALLPYHTSDKIFSFHPHLTVGRIKNTQAQKSFKVNEDRLTVKLNAIQWKFTITEIVLYGVDSTISPEHQEKLITITRVHGMRD